ncbi:F-box family [Galdieria sulphuraria]|uniref:F-box family n=1 Tax=Galdieria sulphuraria TaxID=130081 RepID=M2W5P5_GALSU|nr:F-box family [Galdieria sulphuraria]EME31106.1 F-box family [Galdieria sulphuraria]|eukprot:XP_005707626.1 F-box family [Galdieria sulphuraria]
MGGSSNPTTSIEDSPIDEMTNDVDGVEERETMDVENPSGVLCSRLCKSTMYNWVNGSECESWKASNICCPHRKKLLGAKASSEQSPDSVPYLLFELRMLISYISSKPVLCRGSASFIRDRLRTLIAFSSAFVEKERSCADSVVLSQAAQGREVFEYFQKDLCPLCCGYFSPFNLLPDEILKQILSFLDGPDLARARKVCRKWNNLANDSNLWKELCIRKWRTLEMDVHAWKLFRGYNWRPGESFCWQHLYPFLYRQKSVRCRLQKTGRFICYLIAHQYDGTPLGATDLPQTLIVERRFNVSHLENFVLQDSARVYFEPETEMDSDGYNAFIDYLIQRNRAGLALEGDRRIIFIPPCEYSRNVLGYNGNGLLGIVQHSYPPLS